MLEAGRFVSSPDLCISKNMQTLLCETDDIVVEYSLDSGAEDECTFWYIKQNEKNMSTQECVKLENLQKGKRTSNTKHREAEGRAARDLHVLRDLVLFCLT